MGGMGVLGPPEVRLNLGASKGRLLVDFCPVCFDIQRKESRISKKESYHEECFVFKSDDHQADKTKVTLMQNVIVKVFFKDSYFLLQLPNAFFSPSNS